VSCSVLRCVAVDVFYLHVVATERGSMFVKGFAVRVTGCCSELHHVAACCSELQRVAVVVQGLSFRYFCMLQRVAVC